MTFASETPPKLLLGTKSVTMDTKVLSAVDGEKSRFLPETLRINLAPWPILGKGNNNKDKNGNNTNIEEKFYYCCQSIKEFI